MRTITNYSSKMLLDHPYDSSINWWQLGIITYQMLTQLSPFRGDDEDEIYDSILADEPAFSAYMTRDAIDFIRKLLSKEPEKRLGSEMDGADQVMAHAFFAEINWDDLCHKRVSGPFIPTAANRTDISNFGSEFTLPDIPAIIKTPESMFSEISNRAITDKRP
jgi:serine/threonine protein kinase